MLALARKEVRGGRKEERKGKEGRDKRKKKGRAEGGKDRNKERKRKKEMRWDRMDRCMDGKEGRREDRRMDAGGKEE